MNTQYLHDGGDFVLRWLAHTLSRAIRHDVDTLGKIGGDEFMIVAPETDLEGAKFSASASGRPSRVERRDTRTIPFE